MINNRQGGRRRGRGGQRPQNLGGRPDGNRQDNRQRGNAAQLLEKYKSMARDAQLAGDRVQTEYFLQYADHYYRVLGESRARFEEQRRQRGDDMDDDDGDEDFADSGDEQGSQDNRRDDERPERPERDDRPQRQQRSERPDRDDRPQRDRNERTERTERAERPRRYARDDRNGEEAGNRQSEGDGESIAFEALPPAIGRVDSDDQPEPEAEVAKPRRRTRRPRTDEADGDVAPAA